MFFLKLVINTVLFFIIFNFSRIRQRKFLFSIDSLVLPFSLGLALTVVDCLLRAVFFYSFLSFIIISALAYTALKLVLRKKTDEVSEE
ncbi:MAG: Uncharacterized protein XD63_0783 [Thermoanaerobacterales bacterium 50_218]|nr:MAG: Uncharacterized protein XD63_0783 [Thermoanaerobacterales bacterium 50_218]HAA90362.1 hypothetical protein [Peptococcaceae bacterium]